MSAKFKVGQKVRIIEGSDKAIGHGFKVGDFAVIKRVRGYETRHGEVYSIEVKGQSYTQLLAECQLESIAVQPKEQEMKQEFQAGDKVRITSNSGHNFKVGDIVTFLRKSTYSEYSMLEGVISNPHDIRFGKVDTQNLRAGQFEATFSLDKPLFTAEGTPVVLVTTTNPRDPKFPVLVYEGKAGVPTKYDLNGKAKNGVARRNLTNAVPKVEAVVTEKFIALLDPKTNPNGQQVAISLYDTAQKAREACAVNALRVGGKGPVGIAKVTLVSGRWPV